MADALTTVNELMGNLQADLGNPISLVINLVISTIVTGIVVLIVVEIFSKKFSESVNPLHAFLLAFAVNIINLPIVMGILYAFIAFVPFVGLILPILIWLILTKLLFREVETLHVVLISVICYFLSIYLVPMLIGVVFSFIPIGA